VIEGAEAVRRLEAAGARFFVGVPDSLMKGFCSALDAHVREGRHVVTANEGSAVAAAAGHYLATGRPAVVYMQNSGLGNAVNPLSSLTSARVYGIPMVLMIG
jgi:phosphonopyruvate decarboxylase